MPDDARRLRDIVACAAEVATYLADRSEDDFLEDAMCQRAIERLLTIVGEASKGLSDETRAAIDQPWREIIRLRDKGVHHYDTLSPRTLYRIATESLPALADAVTTYLGE